MDIVIPEGMTDAAMLALVIGFLSPLVLNFIVSAVWPSWAKALAAFAWSVVTGVLTIWVLGAWNGLTLISTILLILVVSITSYQNFWKQIAPTLQRGSAEKHAIEVREKNREESLLKAEVTEAAAATVVQAIPTAEVIAEPLTKAELQRILNEPDQPYTHG